MRHFTDVFRLTKGDLLKLPISGDEAAENLMKAIEGSKHTTLARFLYALGILHIGEETVRLLCSKIQTLKDFCSTSGDDFLRIPRIGEKSAYSLVNFFSNPENLAALDMIGSLGLELTNPDYRSDADTISAFSGMTFVLTGTMPLPRSEIQTMIEKAGGKVSGSVSKKTAYVVAGDEPGGKLENAKQLGVRVIGYPDLVDMLRGVP